MTIKTNKWDASKFLDSPEMMKEYPDYNGFGGLMPGAVK